MEFLVKKKSRKSKGEKQRTNQQIWKQKIETKREPTSQETNH